MNLQSITSAIIVGFVGLSLTFPVYATTSLGATRQALQQEVKENFLPSPPAPSKESSEKKSLESTSQGNILKPGDVVKF